MNDHSFNKLSAYYVPGAMLGARTTMRGTVSAIYGASVWTRRIQTHQMTECCDDSDIRTMDEMLRKHRGKRSNEKLGHALSRHKATRRHYKSLGKREPEEGKND